MTRAGEKLEEAVKTFKYDFDGKVVLDIGSSTGGFTQCALTHGARKVIAIEKGTDQMLPQLVTDPRVELHEKTDIFKMTFGRIGYVDTVLADVSFVSLRKVLAYVERVLVRADADFLVMLKPQFEARPEQLFKGVIKNERIRREICAEFETWVKRKGFVIRAKHDNETTGKNGNVERFYWLALSRWQKQTKNKEKVI
ncbi:hypothetical protein IJG73_03130 [Candidatus Saccharibacteria bacterium]|nr:hypothetical protein [Candidatus Saccharibacteria bacterium]